MIIIGVDHHPEFQQIAWVDIDTGEFQEKRLIHRDEAEKFYRALAGQKVRMGMEASGHARWFERLVAELQFELWIGDAAEIRTKRVRKQKTESPGCSADPALAAGGSFPADLGAELGEPGSAATAVAPSSYGAGAHPHHEPTASRDTERRTALQEEVVVRTWTPAVGIISAGSVGKPTTRRSVGADGSAEPDDRGTDPGDAFTAASRWRAI
jgi:hypothetical protein